MASHCGAKQRLRTLAAAGVFVAGLIGRVGAQDIYGKGHLNARANQLRKMAGVISVDLGQEGVLFDGHGAMSLGASGRLLADYPEPQRSEVLDYLFLPNFGASLQVLKLEIGGDGQSSIGAVASHMHDRNESSCNRGYHLWLLREARARNPGIKAYAVAWSMPYWVRWKVPAQNYSDDDAIDYLVSWVDCAYKTGAGAIDYLADRNELGSMAMVNYVSTRGPPSRTWGPAPWLQLLRERLDAAGHNGTRLVIEGDYDPEVVGLVAADAAFADAMSGGAWGLYYPCYQPYKEIRSAGLLHWSAEDLAMPGRWPGASCWGRSLNMHFLRMNITSVIAKSLLWSVYRDVEDSGAGFIDAIQPWSGNYRVRETLWVTAHTTQFVQPGWTMLRRAALGGGGSSPLARGGSYITYVSPDRSDFTVVVEKLEDDCTQCNKLTGRCSSCKGLRAAPELLTVMLVTPVEVVVGDPENASNSSNMSVDNEYQATSTTLGTAQSSTAVFASPDAGNATICFGHDARDAADEDANLTGTNSSNWTVESEGTPPLPSGQCLSFWSTNATHAFVRLPDLVLDSASRSFSFVAQPGTIYTVSTTAGQAKGDHNTSIPEPQSFPKSLLDAFEDYDVDATPRYFVDYGGSWQVALDPTKLGNQVLKQWVAKQPGFNQWAQDTDPLVVVGEDLADVKVGADIYLTGNLSSAKRAPAARVAPLLSPWADMCLGLPQRLAYEGAPVQQRPCAPPLTARFTYEDETGLVRLGHTGGCLTTRICPKPEVSEVCHLTCSRASDPERRSNQSWTWGTDGTIRLRANTSLCLTAASPDTPLEDASPRLMACMDSAPVGGFTKQHWVAPGDALPAYAGVCVRLTPPPFSTPSAAPGTQEGRRGYCLSLGVDVYGQGMWRLERGVRHSHGGTAIVLAQGAIGVPVGVWHRMELTAAGSMFTAMLDAQELVTVVDTGFSHGMTALHSSWGNAYFDNFQISPGFPPPVEDPPPLPPAQETRSLGGSSQGLPGYGGGVVPSATLLTSFPLV